MFYIVEQKRNDDLEKNTFDKIIDTYSYSKMVK